MRTVHAPSHADNQRTLCGTDAADFLKGPASARPSADVEEMAAGGWGTITCKTCSAILLHARQAFRVTHGHFMLKGKRSAL